jgi:hypothetical protein
MDIPVGIVENLVVNPFSAKQANKEAIKMLVETVITEAKDLKLKCLTSFTSKNSVVHISKKFGAKMIDKKLTQIFMEL